MQMQLGYTRVCVLEIETEENREEGGRRPPAVSLRECGLAALSQLHVRKVQSNSGPRAR